MRVVHQHQASVKHYTSLKRGSYPPVESNELNYHYWSSSTPENSYSLCNSSSRQNPSYFHSRTRQSQLKCRRPDYMYSVSGITTYEQAALHITTTIGRMHRSIFKLCATYLFRPRARDTPPTCLRWLLVKTSNAYTIIRVL